MVFPSGFIEPCLPSRVDLPPSGPSWVHEIKHDGYRLMVRRDGSRVRCFACKQMAVGLALLNRFADVNVPMSGLCLASS